MAILAVNAGSSSLKFSLHRWSGDGPVGEVLLVGTAEGLEPQGRPRLRGSWRDTDPPSGFESALDEPPTGDSAAGAGAHARALAALAALLAGHRGLPALRAVAHRVVHGGARHTGPVVVDESVMAELRRLSPLAPLHQPHNLDGIERFRQAWPAVPQVACFDTAFHAGQGELEQRFALPASLHAQGVRRYGFHGLSYAFVSQTLRDHSARAGGRLLMAHLGNGASLCGAVAGRSITSTMGFSALDGLMMGTRCGALDPGVLLYLMEAGWTHERLERLLYRESGLLGVSGVSADMRQLRADGGEAARRAIALFTHRVVRECGAVVAVLQGLDVMAFSGGIGEHDALLRAEVVARLHWLGVRLDATANAAATGDAVRAIHAPDSAVEVWVVPTDEGSVAAQQAADCLERQSVDGGRGRCSGAVTPIET